MLYFLHHKNYLLLFLGPTAETSANTAGAIAGSIIVVLVVVAVLVIVAVLVVVFLRRYSRGKFSPSTE